MKKRVLIVCIALVMVIPGTLFGGDFISLQIGPSAVSPPIALDQWPQVINNFDVGPEDFFYGADVRVEISILEASVLAVGMPIQSFNAQGFHIIAVPGVGISLDMLGLLDLGLAVGTIGFGEFFPGGHSVFGIHPDLPLYLRAMTDINLGAISIGAYALVDAKVPIPAILHGMLPPDLSNLNPDVSLGLSVLLNLL